MTNKLVCSKCLEPAGVLFNKDESEALSAAYQSGVQEFRSRYRTLVGGVQQILDHYYPKGVHSSAADPFVVLQQLNTLLDREGSDAEARGGDG